MKTNVFLVASLLLAFCSCSSKQEQKEVPVQSLKHEVLMGDEYLIGRTRDLNLMNDSIPVVINLKSENVFQVLNHSRKKVLEMGQVGQGPDDFLMKTIIGRYCIHSCHPLCVDVQFFSCW